MGDPLGSVSRCLLTDECITSASQWPALLVSWAVLGGGQPGIHVSWGGHLLFLRPRLLP